VTGCYDDAEKLINDPLVVGVYVATPPGSHLEYALRVAAAGKPCYVEKPMARSFIECQRMLEAFDRAGLPLFVAYYRRMLPRFLEARKLIDSGRLGRVTGCRYQLTKAFSPEPKPLWRLDPQQSGGGLFLDIGSHVLDLLDYLLGPMVEFGGSAWAVGRDNANPPSAVEDNVAVHFRTERDVVGSGTWNFAGSRNEESLTIEGTDARLSMEVIGVSPLRLAYADTIETVVLNDPPHVQQPLIQTVVDHLLGCGECPSTGASAARTSKVMDAALSSYYAGRDDDFWSRVGKRRP
jgi:predicted dehydrogenase